MVSESNGKSPVKFYVILCIVLCVITAIEWKIFDVKEWRENASLMIPALIGLSLVKFTLVVGWYMHLAHDRAFIQWKFIISVLMALGVFAIVMGVI